MIEYLNPNYSIIFAMGIVLLYIISQTLWFKTNRNYTEIAEDYWNREYLDYSNKPFIIKSGKTI